MKLNLGSGNKNLKGFTNVDYFGKPDIKHDLNKFPYPFKENSIEYIYCSHVLEHLKEPEKFFREIQRILKVGGRCEIIVPHYKNPSAYSTFGHRGFYDESAIDVVCMKDAYIVKNPFKLIALHVKRGKKLFWRKKEIRWLIEK